MSWRTKSAITDVALRALLLENFHFSELRRIALMTAIAEKLRDQGVAMPFWMHDYEVPRVPFEQFTPGLEGGASAMCRP